MGKKKSKNNQGEKKTSNNDEQQLQPQPQPQQQQQKKKSENSEGGGGGGGKQDDGLTTAVLKVPMDCECEGCATKIRRFVRGIQGVETVKGGGELSKLTVAGKIDPVKLQEMVEQKIGKKVQLVSSVPKKDNKDKDKDGGGGGGGGGGEKKAEGKPDKKPDEKKSKEPQVTTAVMKVNLHCQGCIQKIRRVVTKTTGYQDMSIDEQKDQVTVKGTMDMKALAEALKERLKRPVEIVQPKKDNAEKKEKGSGGGGGGAKKEKSGGEEGKTGGDGGGNDGGGQMVEENRIQYVPQEYPNTYMYGFGGGNGLGYPPVEQYHHAPQMVEQYHHAPQMVEQYHHAPQMFSDENPNACSVM